MQDHSYILTRPYNTKHLAGSNLTTDLRYRGAVTEWSHVQDFLLVVLLLFLCSSSHYNPITHPDKVESLLKNVYRPANTLITNVQICLMFWILGEFYVNMQGRIQDLPGKGTNLKRGATYYSAKCFLKTAWKWTKLDRDWSLRASEIVLSRSATDMLSCSVYQVDSGHMGLIFWKFAKHRVSLVSNHIHLYFTT